MDRWIEEYDAVNRIDRTAFQTEINEFMMRFEQQERDEIEALKSTAVDADGFKQVVSKRRRRIAPANVMKGTDAKPVRTFSDFYKFQRMSAKQDKLEQLRARFEQDKKRIAEMHASRVFKPF